MVRYGACAGACPEAGGSYSFGAAMSFANASSGPHIQCSACGNRVLISEAECPTCGESVGFPNVNAAAHEDNRKVLVRRYEKAKEGARAKGYEFVFAMFDEKVAHSSKAVIGCHLNEALRLSVSDKNVFSTYYQLLEAQHRLPDDNVWDKYRRHADEEMYGDHKGKIRYAALSLNERGIRHYGETFLVLAEASIRKRASVFEENTAKFVHDKKIKNLPRWIQGRRATWADRGKLSAVKLAGELNSSMNEDDFSNVLLRDAPKAEDDHFVEVHIWGMLNVRSLEQVSFVGDRKKNENALDELRERLMAYRVQLKELT